MNSIKTIGCALILFGSSLVTVDVQAQILKNGSFESPKLPDLVAKQSYPHSTDIDGWTVGGSSGGVSIIACPAAKNIGGFQRSSENYCQPADGNQYLTLSDQDRGAKIFQTVTTTPTGFYRLRFSSAAARDVPPPTVLGPTLTIRVSVESGGPGGPILAYDEFTPSHSAPLDHPLAWSQKELTFRATSSQTTIAFADILNLDPEITLIDDAAFIDNVVLEALPSKSEISKKFIYLGLVALSLFFVYVFRRIRRSRVQG